MVYTGDRVDRPPTPRLSAVTFLALCCGCTPREGDLCWLCWLLYVPATSHCISGTDLFGQMYGDLFGQLHGDLFGQLYGDLFRQLYGDLFRQLYGDLFGQMYGDLFGQMYGDLFGHLYVLPH